MEVKEFDSDDDEEMSKATHVLDTPVVNAPVDADAREQLIVNGGGKSAYQLQSLETVAASLPQYDVSEALTQSIMRAVEAEPEYGKARDSIITASTIFAVLMAALFVIETQESVGGILSWMVGLAVMYSISLLVSSSQEAETV